MRKKLRTVIRSLPIIGPALRRLNAKIHRRKSPIFITSGQYWEDRYRLGGTSGSGSYGKLAEFKAKVLNDFVKEEHISSIVEFGCGDGAQLSLAEYPRYIGFDVSPTAVEMCRDKFSTIEKYRFFTTATPEYQEFKPVDLALSLDVIYHLIEDDVFNAYMKKLFSSSTRFVIIYSYDLHKEYDSKHELGRNFTSWILENIPQWKLLRKISNPYQYDASNPNETSQADFYVYEKSS